MGGKLLWTAVTIFLIEPVFTVPAGSAVVAVLAFIGAVLMWLDK